MARRRRRSFELQRILGLYDPLSELSRPPIKWYKPERDVSRETLTGWRRYRVKKGIALRNYLGNKIDLVLPRCKDVRERRRREYFSFLKSPSGRKSNLPRHLRNNRFDVKRCR